jgi:hypothetical protein
VFVKGKTSDVVSTTQPHRSIKERKREKEKEMMVTNIYIRIRKRKRKRKKPFVSHRSFSFFFSLCR